MNYTNITKQINFYCQIIDGISVCDRIYTNDIENYPDIDTKFSELAYTDEFYNDLENYLGTLDLVKLNFTNTVKKSDFLIPSEFCIEKIRDLNQTYEYFLEFPEYQSLKALHSQVIALRYYAIREIEHISCYSIVNTLSY